MFADITLLLIVGLSGIGLFVFGVISRHGILCLIGCLALLFMIVGYEGYSTDEWMETTAVAEVTTKATHYPVTSHSTGGRVSDGPSPFIARAVEVSSGSALESKLIDCIAIPIQPVGSPPVGTLLYVGTLDNSANIIKEFGSMNVTALNSSVTTYEFCLPENDAYLIEENDRIGILYDDGDSSNFLQVRIDANNPFDGTATRMAQYTTSWSSVTGTDLTLEMTFSVDRTTTETDIELFTVEYSFPDEIRAVSGVTVGVVLFFSMRKFGFS